MTSFNFTGAQILGDLMHHQSACARTVAVAQAGERPRMFQCVPEVENLAPANEPCRAVPDPFGFQISHDHHGCVGPPPAQLPQLCA